MEDQNNFRLQKISMIVADVLLVLFGVIYAFSGEGPMAPMQFFWVVVSVTLGGILAFIPFFLEFKIRANLAEYDRSQANLENAERIERVLAEIHEIAAVVARQADRSEEAMTKTTDALAKLEDFQPGAGGAPAADTTALGESVESLRREVAEALDSREQPAAVATLISGLEVSLLNLSQRVEEIQAQLAQAPANATQPSAMATEGDEVIEPSALDEVTDGDERVDALMMPEGSLPETVHALAPGDELPDDAGDDPETVPDEDLLVEEHASTDNPDEELEGVEDVSEDLAVKDAAYDAAERERTPEHTGAGLAPGDEFPDDAGDDPETAPDEDLLVEEHASTDNPDEELEGAEDVPEDLAVKDAAYDAAERELAADAESEDGPVFTDSRAEAERSSEPAETLSPEFDDEPAPDSENEVGPETDDDDVEFHLVDTAVKPSAESDEEDPDAPEQQDLMEDLPPPREKPKKSPKGSTVLIAQVLIGIGNKPYVRGKGPGLKPDEGVPMEFVEIGKWQWVAPESDEPMECQIYRNDEVPAKGDAIILQPGHRRTVSPSFSR